MTATAEIRERTIDVHCNGRRVPTALWSLHANPGGHAAVPRSELKASREFLARKLKAERDA